MTRKRFIRLMMAHDIQRNEAVRMARDVSEYGSYDRLFAHYRVLLVFRPACVSIRRFGQAVRRAARGFETFASAFMGIDFASGEDRTAVLHHARPSSGVIFDEMAEHIALQRLAKEEHEAAHAAGRNGKHG